MNRFALRYSLPVLMLALSGSVSAVGLGELRGQPVLGERIRLEIDLVGVEKQKLDASCFRLVQPAGAGDLPWLKKAALSVRKGAPPVLEIRSEVPLREPIVQLAVRLGCGHEISRDYILMASPVGGAALPAAEPHSQEIASPPVQPSVRQPLKRRSVTPAVADAPPRLPPARRAERRPAAGGFPDRLMLSYGAFVGEPSLRLATELLFGGAEAKETQREILRLEFRMLMAMQEQATSQLATAEKLRNMEGTLGELQRHAAEFAKRVDQGSVAPAPGTALPSDGTQPSPPQPAAATAPPVAEAPVPPQAKSPLPSVQTGARLSEWSLYGVLLGTVFGLAGWLGWRNYRLQKQEGGEDESPIQVPEVQVDPKRAGEREEPGGVDLPFEPAAMGMPMQVDVELDAGSEYPPGPPENLERAPAQRHDSQMSITATTLDEHFEANPVMELADIMLSFGRVKGAAQALQEYIDRNPQEALQPWIRLMDVYRMAGMRAEFENVARNLNQQFNVEVQSWNEGQSGLSIPSPESESELPVAPRPQSLEDLPRLVNIVVELWNAGDVVGYLYQLLRDNRGGQRQGFALPVVEDVLFLIELKETANRMDKV